MIGERRFPNRYGRLLLPEAGYGRDLYGQWWVRPPGGDTVKVKSEEIVDHGDGRITLRSSINGHGVLLERGVWRIEKGDKP